MRKILVIVESPAKSKTINKYLGSNYIVKSSSGHIRDLSKNILTKYDKQKNFINKIGIDPYNNWKANYQILPGKKKIVHKLKLLASHVKHIYLATDLDREGEAIAWHLQEVIGGAKKI